MKEIPIRVSSVFIRGLESLCNLRCEPVDQPLACVRARIAKAIMQSVRPALPEFDLVRLQPVSAPMRWQRNFAIGKTLFHLLPPGIENLPAVDHFALLRNPRPEPAAGWPRVKIGGGILARGPFHGAADPDLALEFRPEKIQGGVRVRLELFPFLAVVIRKEGE